MNVRGPHVVTALRTYELADRPVDGNRVASGLDAAKADSPARIGREFSAQVHVRLCRVLAFVVALRRSVPHVDLSSAYRLSRRIGHARGDEDRIAGRRRADNRSA